MKTLAIDIETYSSVDLIKSGVYKYVEAEDFTVLLMAYSIDGGPVQLMSWADSDDTSLPLSVTAALVSPNVLKTAFNANFERTCLAKFFDLKMPPEQWECTMVKASMLGLPLSLEMVGKVLKLKDQKDAAGKALIKYFSLPCKPTKANGMRSRNLPEHAPDKWEMFKNYCIQDVKTEQAIREKISFFEIPDQEKKLWYLDQRINDSGVLLDNAFVQAAIEVSNENTIKLTAEAIALTNLDNPNSASQLKDWLSTETGENVTSLTKEAIPALLQNTDCEVVTRVLNIRQELSKTSVKKYQAMQKCICADNRVRGLLQFYGANRTGRWAGRLVQVQNLPQNHLADLDLAREVVKSGDTDLVEMLFGNVPDTLSQLIRTAFIAPDGYRFIVADFSAIEARVIAWLAGERWRLDVFNTHGKIYEASASQMFKVPIESVTKGSALRQKGKVAELACIAHGQLVLTDRGLVPIECVQLSDKLWDGDTFINHDGVIFKGVKKVITYEGLTATEDHWVWINGQSEPIQFGHAAASRAHLAITGNGRKNIRLGEDYQPRKKMEKRVERSTRIDRMHSVSGNTMDVLLQFNPRSHKRMSSLLTTSLVSKMVGQKNDCCQTKVHESKRYRVSKLWRTRNRIQIPISLRSLYLPDTRIRLATARIGNRSNRQQWSLRSRKYSACAQRTKSSQSAYLPTYDILNAGPNNRFTVSNVLVHNCGYQGGPNALISMGALKMGVPENELPKIIAMWRNANKAIVRLWSVVEEAAIMTVATGEPKQIMHGIRFMIEKGILFIQLPSGRRLSYLKPNLKKGVYGKDSLTYEGMDQTTKQWKIQDTYGGKLVENIVQAVARDCLAVAMLRLSDAGFKIVMSVHDEVVIEDRYEHVRLGLVNKIMGEPIPWAKGLPLTADSYETKFYKKD